MSTTDQVMIALSMTETAVQDMAEAGIPRHTIATALADHMMRQISLALPDPALRAIWLAALKGYPCA